MTKTTFLLCGILAFSIVLSSATEAQTAGANAQCTITAPEAFGRMLPYHGDPAPPLNAPCSIGNQTGYISRTSSSVGINSNSRCTITVSGRTLEVPYEKHPAPALGAPCQVGNITGRISVTSVKPRPAPPALSSTANAQAAGTNAECTITAPEGFGRTVPYHADPAPPLNAPCSIGNQTGYISRTSSNVGINSNSRCTITVSGRTLEVPYEAHPTPAVGVPCRVGSITGRISATSLKPRPAPPPSERID